MRRIGTAVLVVALGAVLVAGCSSTTATSPSGSATATASASASASGTRAAWVRGTKVTLTNSSGSSVQYGSKAGETEKTPEVTYSTLANGASAADSDDWNSSSTTGIFYRVKYPDSKVAEFCVANGAIGSPSVNYREGPWRFDWSNYPYDQITLSEGESKTVTVANHSITFNRKDDDGDFKVWTVTLG